MDLSLPAPSPPLPPAARERRPWYHWRRLGFNFLTISVLAHLLFGAAATYLVVQTITAKRKQTFAAPPQSPNAPTRAIEHKVQMQKKQQTMSAPAPVKRITTTSNSKIALPAMPAMPKMDSAVVPVTMAGMGGTGVGVGLGLGSGSGSGGGGGGGGPSLFGFRENRGSNALVGTFYDLKQSRGNQPTNMMGDPDRQGPREKSANDNNRKTVAAFVSSGFSEGALSLYFRGPTPLYATQIFIPTIDADDGPKSFNLANQVKPRRWLVIYKARVTPPESGRYRFVGAADDYLVVRFNGRIVLDGGIAGVTANRPVKTYNTDGIGGSTPFLHEGEASEVEAGNTYPLEILIGELPGGQFRAMLLVEKEGADYIKDSKGNPLFPVFKVGKGPSMPGNALPRVCTDTPWSVWKAAPYSTSN